MFNLGLDTIIYYLPAVIIALSVHEFAHAYISYKLGDQLPKREGRLTLNPFKHIDIIGFITLLLVGFGWAKPVRINPRAYQDERMGIICTSLAGPLSNFIVAFLLILFKAINLKFHVMLPDYVWVLLNVTIAINLGLGIFNLIPLPPLDGSKVLLAFLPEDTVQKLTDMTPIFMAALIALLFLGVFDTPLLAMRNGVWEFFEKIIYFFIY